MNRHTQFLPFVRVSGVFAVCIVTNTLTHKTRQRLVASLSSPECDHWFWLLSSAVLPVTTHAYTFQVFKCNLALIQAHICIKEGKNFASYWSVVNQIYKNGKKKQLLSVQSASRKMVPMLYCSFRLPLVLLFFWCAFHWISSRSSGGKASLIVSRRLINLLFTVC